MPEDGLVLGEVRLSYGDRFFERYYSNRWYNTFEIHDRDSNQIKCWYCNVSYPAELGEETILFRDLALDLLVYPDGRQHVLDEDEFALLELPDSDRTRARAALDECRMEFQTRLFT